MQDIGTDNEIERRVEAQLAELPERRQADIARAAIARNGILAAIEAKIVHAPAQGLQRLAPRAFAATDIEHVVDLPTKIVFGRRNGQRDLTLEFFAGIYRVTRAAVPLVEIVAVVDFPRRAFPGRQGDRINAATR